LFFNKNLLLCHATRLFYDATLMERGKELPKCRKISLKKDATLLVCNPGRVKQGAPPLLCDLRGLKQDATLFVCVAGRTKWAPTRLVWIGRDGGTMQSYNHLIDLLFHANTVINSKTTRYNRAAATLTSSIAHLEGRHLICSYVKNACPYSRHTSRQRG